MKVRPLGDRLIVNPSQEEEVTKAGIVLPDTIDKEKKAQGEIIAIGDGEKIQKLNLKTGDKVLYSSYAGSDIKVEDEEYKVLNDEEVLAVIEGQPAQAAPVQDSPQEDIPTNPY